MGYSTNDGVRIHYEVEGSGDPMVLQHGSAGNIQRWYNFGFVDALKSACQLILIDGRGHGASDKPHDSDMYALERRVNDVTSVLDDLGIQQAHFWGYSMGGWIGFGMAKHVPGRVRSLILGGAHPYEEITEAFHGVDGTDPDAFVAAMVQMTGTSMSPAVRERILNGNDLRALAAAMHDRESIEEVLPTMSMPCLLYAGESDPRLPKVRRSAEAITNSTFFSIPELDHPQASLASEVVVPHVIEFLRTVH